MMMAASGFVAALSDQFLSLLVMVLLLGASGFFSGSETALFSLTGYERLQLRRGAGKLGRVVDRLLRDAQQLLLIILFANLAVNILIFTISSIVVYRLAHGGYRATAAAVPVATLLAVVLFGEILPKAAAYNMRTVLSKAAALPLLVICDAIHVPMKLVRWIIVDPAVRVLTGPGPEPQIRQEDLRRLLDAFAREQLVKSDQADLLRNVIELRDLRVRQIMKPRVALACCEIDAEAAELAALIRQRPVSVVAVYRGEMDAIAGVVRARRFRLERPGRIEDLLEPVTFVPDQQRVDQLVHFFRETGANVAAVVDEYGGFVGLVTMADVVEELLGHLASAEPVSIEPGVRAVAAGRHVADGAYEMDNFCETFHVPPPEMSVETVGGLVMSLLGHLPAPGERVEYHGLILEAAEVLDRKVMKVIVIDRRNEK